MGERYSFTNGWTMKREGPNRLWRLRDEKGEPVDYDRYRHDLIERHRLAISEHVGAGA